MRWILSMSVNLKFCMVHIVGASLGPTHERTYRAASDGTICSADAQTGQTGRGNRSDQFAGAERRNPMNARPGGTPSGQTRVGLFKDRQAT